MPGNIESAQSPMEYIPTDNRPCGNFMISAGTVATILLHPPAMFRAYAPEITEITSIKHPIRKSVQATEVKPAGSTNSAATTANTIIR